MEKYILYTDFRSGYGNEHGLGWDYKVMAATDLVSAIAEADEAWDDEKVYLLRIMEKVGKIEHRREAVSYRHVEYRAVLCKRSYNGWHLNNEKNGECEHVAARNITNDGYEDIYCIK